MDIEKILQMRESSEIEWKAAEGGLPKSIWETYSAFANTNGGTILLGIEETKTGYKIANIDSSKILTDFWNLINNNQKISCNILSDKDVVIESIEGKDIVIINVPRATRDQRPIFTGQNPFTGTFRRNFDGDYKSTEREVRSMLADQTAETQDKKVLKNYSLKDLSLETINSYRQRLSSRNPGHPFLESSIQDFLFDIGAWGRSREHQEEGLTVAGLLMFGKERCITDEFPNYFLDYRELLEGAENQRWSHRLVSSDGTWTGNLYDFYFKVVNRITDNINIPFQLDGLFRQDDTNVHVALREALVNSLVHADYYGERGIVIEKHKTFFKFTNPGNLRVSIEQALRGGVSDPRNSNLFKMFTLLGIGERAGSGIPTIETAWKKQHWRAPELLEEIQPERTVLILRTISLLPQESIDFLRAVMRDEYENISNDEIFALVTAHQEGIVTNARLQYLLQQQAGDLTKLLQILVEKKLLQAEGKGRGTKYILADLFAGYLRVEQHSEESYQHNGEVEQHSEESYQHNGEVERHSEESYQHNGEVEQHSEESCQHNDEVEQHIHEDSNIREHIRMDEDLYKSTEKIRVSRRANPELVRNTICRLCAIQAFKPSELSTLLNRNQESIKNHYIGPLVRNGRLRSVLPEKTHPNQAYVAVVQTELESLDRNNQHEIIENKEMIKE